MTDTRTETDSIGAIEVPASAYWGAQTERSIENFPFPPSERMPIGIVHALAIVKQAAARVNRAHGLDGTIADAIDAAAGEVIAGKLDDQFPLVIWQTGSGTQSNMNANEVIAGRANSAPSSSPTSPARRWPRSPTRSAPAVSDRSAPSCAHRPVVVR